MTKSGKRVAKKRPARRRKKTTPTAEMKMQQNLPLSPPEVSSPSSSFVPEVTGVGESGGSDDRVKRMMNSIKIFPLCTPNEEAMGKEDDHLHRLVFSCSICTTEFPANEEPKIEYPGSSDEDWKDLVFRALCMHLNIKDFYERIVSAEDGIMAAMKAFHMCQECLVYGWRLVELDQYLSKLKTEINSLADSFRTVIGTFISTNEIPENDVHYGAMKVGLAYMREFKKLATQSAPLIDTVAERILIADLNLSYTVDNVVDGTLNEPTFASTEELQDEIVNEKDRLSVNEDVSLISNGNDTQEDELLFLNGTEGTEGDFNDEDEFDRILSPSPPYSPLSPLFMEDTSVTIHDSLNMNGEDPSLAHTDLIQEEEDNTRPMFDDDGLFVEKMCANTTLSESFYPIMEDLPAPVVQPCGRRVGKNREKRPPKPEPLKQIKLKRISKVGKQKKNKMTLSKRNPTKRRRVVGKSKKTEKIVISSDAPRRLRISQKMIASLPSNDDVEAYKILTRRGIRFRRVQVKLESLNLHEVWKNGVTMMEDDSHGGKSKHVVRVNSMYYDELFDIKIDQRIRTSPTRHSPRSSCKEATKSKTRALLDPNSSIVPIVSEMVKELSMSPSRTTREQKLRDSQINHASSIGTQSKEDSHPMTFEFDIQIHSPILLLQNESNENDASTSNNLPPLLQPVDPSNDKADISSSSENDLSCQAPCLAPYFITAVNNNDAICHQVD